MFRPLGVFVAFVVLASPCAASTSRASSKVFDGWRAASFAKAGMADVEATTPAGELSLTTETEVLLDGRGCEYKNVPATAVVVRMELAPDRRTVLKIEFSSRK